jgi:hypothetical protein
LDAIFMRQHAATQQFAAPQKVLAEAASPAYLFCCSGKGVPPAAFLGRFLPENSAVPSGTAIFSPASKAASRA